MLVVVVFNVPSTARSYRDGTPIYCPLRRKWSSINAPFRPGIEPRAVAWQSITLPLRYASSPSSIDIIRVDAYMVFSSVYLASWWQGSRKDVYFNVSVIIQTVLVGLVVSMSILMILMIKRYRLSWPMILQLRIPRWLRLGLCSVTRCQTLRVALVIDPDCYHYYSISWLCRFLRLW